MGFDSPILRISPLEVRGEVLPEADQVILRFRPKKAFRHPPLQETFLRSNGIGKCPFGMAEELTLQ